ncbi:hypothetical protein FD755_013620, partial [Muntiacus reevesi]
GHQKRGKSEKDIESTLLKTKETVKITSVTISSSVVPFSCCPQSLPASAGSQEPSPTPQFKSINFSALSFLYIKKIPVPPKDFTSEPRLIVIRSFDVNKPGCEVDDLKGGAAGGSILKGVLKVGQETEVRPGIVSKDSEGKLMCKPIFSKIVSLFAKHNDLQMVGQVLGAAGALPEIFTELKISYFLLRWLLGKVQKLCKNEVLMVNIGSLSAGGRVNAVKADLGKIVLTNPVCTEKHWRLIGWGQIRRGVTIKPTVDDD